MPDQEHDPEFEVKITVDKNKLKYKYKIEPYADLTVDDGESDEYSLYSKQSTWFQAEERIKGPKKTRRQTELEIISFQGRGLSVAKSN